MADLHTLVREYLAALDARGALHAPGRPIPTAQEYGEAAAEVTTRCDALRAAVAVRQEPECTGITARWCPRCGDCVCPSPETAMDDPRCPLHAPSSPHGESEPDTGWRDRPPTETEVRAHHAAHHRGPIYESKSYWMSEDWNGYLTLHTVVMHDDRIHRCDVAAPFGRCWRPLTASGDPAPWPEVTP